MVETAPETGTSGFQSKELFASQSIQAFSGSLPGSVLFAWLYINLPRKPPGVQFPSL